MGKVRATGRNSAVSISQTDSAEVDEVRNQRMRDDMIYSETSFEYTNEVSFVISSLSCLDLRTYHSVHEEDPIVEVS